MLARQDHITKPCRASPYASALAVAALLAIAPAGASADTATEAREATSAPATRATAAATRSAKPARRKAPRAGIACGPRRGVLSRRTRGRRVLSGRTRGLLRCTTTRKPTFGSNRARSGRKARASALTFNLNPTTYNWLGTYNYPGWVHYRGAWTRWTGTTQVRFFQQLAGDTAIGSQEDYYYWSSQGWILYRILKCSSWNACFVDYLRPGF